MITPTGKKTLAFGKSLRVSIRSKTTGVSRPVRKECRYLWPLNAHRLSRPPPKGARLVSAPGLSLATRSACWSRFPSPSPPAKGERQHEADQFRGVAHPNVPCPNLTLVRFQCRPSSISGWETFAATICTSFTPASPNKPRMDVSAFFSAWGSMPMSNAAWLTASIPASLARCSRSRL